MPHPSSDRGGHRHGELTGSVRRLPKPVYLTAAALLFAAVAYGVHGFWTMRQLPMPALAFGYAVTSAFVFLAYGVDKYRAERGYRPYLRARERKLHLLEALGGWPGALLASRYFWHKVTKGPYVTKRRMMIALNVTAVAWWYLLGPQETVTMGRELLGDAFEAIRQAV